MNIVAWVIVTAIVGALLGFAAAPRPVTMCPKIVHGATFRESAEDGGKLTCIYVVEYARPGRQGGKR